MNTLNKYLMVAFFCSMQSLCAVAVQVHGLDDHSDITREIVSYIQREKDLHMRLDNEGMNTVSYFYKSEIKKILEYHGYFQSVIDFSIIPKNGDDTIFDVHISLGKPLLIDNVSVELIGASDISSDDLKEQLAATIGHAFNQQIYLKDKSQLMQLVDNFGYVRSDVEQSLVYVDLMSNTASIRYNVRLGKRYRFGNINIQSSNLSDRFIQAYAPKSLSKGSFFSNALIEDWYSNLVQAPYFSMVTIEPNLNILHTDSDQIDIKVNTQPTDLVRHVTGIGYDSLDHFYLNHMAQMRPITSHGHLLSLLMRYNQKRKLTSELVYTIPSITNPTEQVSDLRLSHRPMTDYTSGQYMQQKIEFNQHHSLDGQLIQGSLGFLHESYAMTLEESLITTNVPYVKATMVWSDWLRKHGDFITNRIIIEGEAGFKKSQPYYKALFNSNIRLDLDYFSIEMTYHRGKLWRKQSDAVPLSRYFALGSSSGLRGYNNYSIGPGTKIEASQIEIQKEIGSSGVYAYGFFDIGNSGDDLKLSEYYKSLGAGLLYRSSLDFDVKLSVAHPIHGRGIKVGLSIEKIF